MFKSEKTRNTLGGALSKKDNNLGRGFDFRSNVRKYLNMRILYCDR